MFYNLNVILIDFCKNLALVKIKRKYYNCPHD